MKNYLLLLILMMLFASCKDSVGVQSMIGTQNTTIKSPTDTMTFKAISLIDGTITPVKFLRQNSIYRVNDTVWVDSRNGFIATNFIEATPENTVRWGSYVKYRIGVQNY